jgi:hypothetical protein
MSSCWISYEHLQQKGESTNQNGHELDETKKEEELMVKMVKQWSGNHKVVGSTPSQVNFLKIFFFHSHKNIHKYPL